MEEIATEPADLSAPARWNGWRATAVILFGVAALYLVQIIIGVIIAIIVLYPQLQAQPHSIPNTQQLLVMMLNSPSLFLISVTSESLMAFIAIGLAMSSLGASRQQLGFGRPFRILDVGVGILAGIALIGAGDVVGSLQQQIFGPHPQPTVQIIMSHHGIVSFMLDFVSVALVAGICEELMFRGVMFTALAQRMPVWTAAVLSGLAFGLAHAELWSLAALTVVGIGLALLYSRTRSIWPNMVAHTTFNAFSLVLIYFFPQYAK
ncbi:MAG TPA: CPBP family intramembrane glutamic endopeptidase [Candidatus Eremiobacteraceae bacterium]|nr:CPBP family intramembrane glutamic endopeptidase [Candidatus Eremiobacteraceae bacterium]